MRQIFLRKELGESKVRYAGTIVYLKICLEGVSSVDPDNTGRRRQKLLMSSGGSLSLAS